MYHGLVLKGRKTLVISVKHKKFGFEKSQDAGHQRETQKVGLKGIKTLIVSVK
jgi:hypothetical protein